MHNKIEFETPKLLVIELEDDIIVTSSGFSQTIGGEEEDEGNPE